VSHLEFEGAIFLNLTQDHLDYHQTFEDYYQAKKKLFLLATKKQVINIDDPYGMRLYNELSNRSITIGQDPRADYRIKEVVLTLQSSSCLLEHKNSNFLVELPMIGSYHLYNMVAAIALAHQEGQSLEALCDLSKSFQSVPGRSEMITTSMGFSIMVDYAHKPDALLKLLKSLREAGAKKITTIFGCGGERDQMKRPMMAKIAEQLSDRVIVTTDNPRKEDPHQIIQQIVQGFEKKNFEVIVDRKSAILNGLKNAQKGEVILIAGRGHEKEQKLKTASIPFLDSEVAKNLLIGI
jgi:UDP-N-acetylmuramoyl-L-alanyl-D-glutamate--2,6-diaminopimelate ligase